MKSIVFLALLTTAGAPLGAQYMEPPSQQLPRSVVLGGTLHYGSPQGEFASNVNAAFGANGFVGWQIGRSPLFVRADLGYDIYGSRTRRVPLGSGPLGLINVDVNTTNNIFTGGVGLQAGAPKGTVTP